MADRSAALADRRLASRIADTRLTTVWIVAAIAVPTAIAASIPLAAVDLAYHLRAGDLMLDAGSRPAPRRVHELGPRRAVAEPAMGGAGRPRRALRRRRVARARHAPCGGRGDRHRAALRVVPQRRRLASVVRRAHARGGDPAGRRLPGPAPALRDPLVRPHAVVALAQGPASERRPVGVADRRPVGEHARELLPGPGPVRDRLGAGPGRPARDRDPDPRGRARHDPPHPAQPVRVPRVGVRRVGRAPTSGSGARWPSGAPRPRTP